MKHTVSRGWGAIGLGPDRESACDALPSFAGELRNIFK